ncbi:Sperm flagellar protein 1 [Dufourea novaeangliae]|uniref:Sperm flagellar protein 1 n=1 Tax=Dufourea novaeangliae TaxID=178035 RepID=A0A154P985_DUFNO|nr:Sperm flagellar protein 1 [Dufourea novaeangliae]
MADENWKISEDQAEQLYTWIATIPFSKPKKNLTRNFSDAVLMAEVLKVYYPRFVDLHNYVPANNLTTKKENWNILNRKVFSKINMKLSKDMINQLANSQPGVAEHLLLELRSKILKNSDHSNALCNEKEKDSAEDDAFLLNETRNIFSLLLSKGVEDADTSRTQAMSQSIKPEDVVPRHVCTQLKQELRAKDDIISTLNCKVAYLENAMKVKDLRISNLASQILQNAVDSEQLAKNQTNEALSKPRTRAFNIPEKMKPEE